SLQPPNGAPSPFRQQRHRPLQHQEPSKQRSTSPIIPLHVHHLPDGSKIKGIRCSRFNAFKGKMKNDQFRLQLCDGIPDNDTNKDEHPQHGGNQGQEDSEARFPFLRCTHEVDGSCEELESHKRPGGGWELDEEGGESCFEEMEVGGDGGHDEVVDAGTEGVGLGGGKEETVWGGWGEVGGDEVGGRGEADAGVEKVAGPEVGVAGVAGGDEEEGWDADGHKQLGLG
ncbi:hypothetical protein BC829DRAFT_465635, partial [Chytridium lagenaria]